MNSFLNSRYRLLRPIGEGGYGKVWFAYDTINNSEIAIKIYEAPLLNNMKQDRLRLA